MSKKDTATTKNNASHNYLNTQKSNAHTKMNGNLVQLWFGGAIAVAFVLSMQPAMAALNDGNLEVGEQCDDGNTVNGDGCSDLGEIEEGFISSCANPVFSYGAEQDGGLIGGLAGAGAFQG
jgi:cysteine-rich repeat protein